MNNKKAFTLVELLVVISIIALLLAILMPSLGKARKQAQAVVCKANLKQWGVCYSMYLQDYNQRFDPGVIIEDGVGKNAFWMDTLKPYYTDVDELRSCPVAKKTDPQSTTGFGDADSAWGSTPEETGNPDAMWGSYGVNGHINDLPDGFAELWGGDSRDLWRTSMVNNTSEIPLLADAAWFHSMPQYKNNPSAEPPLVPSAISVSDQQQMQRFCIPRHSYGVNVLLMDTSVRSVGLKELWDLRWHRSWMSDKSEARPKRWPSWIEKY